jgi:hypothetical protein
MIEEPISYNTLINYVKNQDFPSFGAGMVIGYQTEVYTSQPLLLPNMTPLHQTDRWKEWRGEGHDTLQTVID